MIDEMIPGALTGTPIRYTECSTGPLQQSGTQRTAQDNPLNPAAGEIYTPCTEKTSLLIPPPVSKKVDAAAISESENTSQIETKKPATAEISLKFTEAAAGAVSNSSAASIALQNLSSSNMNVGADTADAEIRKQRESQWLAKQKEVDGLADGLGKGLDGKIKDTVIALQVNGFNTRQSCEGHIDWGCGAPWVDVQAPGEPEPLFGAKGNSIPITLQYNGQEESFQQVAAKNGITVEEMLDRKNYRENPDKYQGMITEARLNAYKNGETAEYMAWRQRSKALCKSMEALTTIYNQTKNVPESGRIKFFPFGDDTFRIFTGSKQDLDRRDWSSRSDSDKQALGERLVHYRGAMNEFAQFLKDSFMANGPAVNGP